MRSLPLASLVLLSLASLAHATGDTRTRDNMRNARYGEIIIVKGGPLQFTGEVYNTLGLNDCPEAEWKALDPARIKKEYKARTVLLNGPRYFVMDSSSLANPGSVATFGGLQARHLASVEIPLTNILRGRAKPYTENTVNRTTRYVYRKGLPTFQLISPDGKTYVMQTYARIVDPRLSMSDLPGLGRRLQLPEGWQYKVVVPKEDLVLTTTGKAYVLQDDLQNSYQRK